MISNLMFKSLTELIFMSGTRWGSSFLFLHEVTYFPNTICAETVLSPLVLLAPLSNII